MSKIDFCSFRDPAGVVLKYEGRILRLVKNEHESDLLKLLSTKLFRDLTTSKIIPNSHRLSESEFGELAKKLPSINHVDLDQYKCCLEHEVVPFPSYPYEWSPEMLSCAALFTVELAQKLLDRNLGLKDASPYNVLFIGPNPIFIDLLSFETRDSKEMIWLPYAQFVRTFLLPLIVNQQADIPLSQIFLNKTDGLEPEEVYKMLSLRKLFKPGVLSLVTMSAFFSKIQKKSVNESSVYQRKKASSSEMAKFVLDRMLSGLKKQVTRFAPKQKKSAWTSYFSLGESYNQTEFQIKSDMVQKLLKKIQPKSLLDVGCNTGYFSIMAAKENASVVAIDSDPAVIDEVWREARKSKYSILPLVVDFCRPSPAVGWRNAEQLSFLQRAENAFDTVMMLAVLHHNTVTARIPMEDIANVCTKLTTKNLIIEFVAPEDPMFRRLLRGRDALYNHLTKEYFEEVFYKHFKMISCEQVGTTARWMYHLEKKHV